MGTIEDAIEFAARAHSGQYRKGTRIPYIVHPLGVAKTLIEYGCPDHVVIAGILHDTVEDTPVSLDEIRQIFGKLVADLVEAASEPDKTDTWENRKKHTIGMLKNVSHDAVILILADKLDNIRAIREDLERDGDGIWDRFNRPKERQKWYYEGLAAVFADRLTDAKFRTLLDLFTAEVDRVFSNCQSKSEPYPKFNVGHFLPDPHQDLAWAEGYLCDGRPFRIECWIQSGISLLTYYFSVRDLENATEQELKDLLIAEGLVEFDDDKYLNSGFQGINLSAKKHLDVSNNEMWALTIIVGDEDGTYINDHFPLSKYEYPPSSMDPYIYESKDNNPDTTAYFMAICKEYDDGESVPMYQGYFINNTPVQIEIMFEIRPGDLRKMKPGTTVKDLLSHEADAEFISRQTKIPAYGYARLGMRYFEWELDFCNARHLFIQTAGVEKHINFYMRIALRGLQETDRVPILNRPGYICLPSSSG